MTDDELRKWRFERAEDAKNENGRNLDKLIFVCASGVFVLTINFLTFIDGPVVAPYTLILSWIFLASCIATQAAAYLAAIRQNQYFIVSINKTGLEPNSSDKQNMKLSQNIWTFNYLTFSFLVLGVLFLTYFATVNLIAKNHVSSSDLQKIELRSSFKPVN